jgi:hypothetical protein
MSAAKNLALAAANRALMAGYGPAAFRQPGNERMTAQTKP